MACCGRNPQPPILQPDPLPNIWAHPSLAGLVPVPADRADEILDGG